MSNLVLLLVVSLLLTWTGSLPVAHAQEAEQSAPADAPVALSEVAVHADRDLSYQTPSATTATRLETPILETPVSIQVVPRAVLEDQQVIELKEALKNVSGVQPAFGFGSLSRSRLRTPGVSPGVKASPAEGWVS